MPDIVIVSVRAVAPVLAVAVKVISPLFVPDAALNVNQVEAVLVTFQVILDVILNVALLAAGPILIMDGETAKPGKMVILAVINCVKNNEKLVI